MVNLGKYGQSGKFRQILVNSGKMTTVGATAVGVTAVRNDLKF